MEIKQKRGMSTNIAGIILLVIGLAVIVGLIIYFGTAGKANVSNFLEKLFFIKRGV